MSAKKIDCVKLFTAVACILVVLSGAANAAEPTGPYIDYKLKVTALVSIAEGSFVYFDGNHQCNSNRVFIDARRADYKRLYSTLLAARMLSSFVSVDLRDPTSTEGLCDGSSSSIANLCVGSETGPCFTGW